MRRKAILLLLLLATACETKEHADAEAGAIKKAQEAAARAATHANTTVEEDIGVPECDAYIRKFEACLAAKVPESEQARLRSTLDEQRKRWRAAASNAFERAGLADQCRSAAAAAKQELDGYGCEF
jgi:hypothetical protein